MYQRVRGLAGLGDSDGSSDWNGADPSVVALPGVGTGGTVSALQKPSLFGVLSSTPGAVTATPMSTTEKLVMFAAIGGFALLLMATLSGGEK